MLNLKKTLFCLCRLSVTSRFNYKYSSVQLIVAFILGRFEMILLVLLVLASAVTGKKKSNFTVLSCSLCCWLSIVFTESEISQNAFNKSFMKRLFLMENDFLII